MAEKKNRRTDLQLFEKEKGDAPTRYSYAFIVVNHELELCPGC